MKNPLGVWAICDKESQKMIGYSNLKKLDEIKQEVELGYFLKRDYWGRGLTLSVSKRFFCLCEFDFKKD